MPDASRPRGLERNRRKKCATALPYNEPGTHRPDFQIRIADSHSSRRDQMYIRDTSSHFAQVPECRCRYVKTVVLEGGQSSLLVVPLKNFVVEVIDAAKGMA
jgi:hypothetical protein